MLNSEQWKAVLALIEEPGSCLTWRNHMTSAKFADGNNCDALHPRACKFTVIGAVKHVKQKDFTVQLDGFTAFLEAVNRMFDRPTDEQMAEGSRAYVRHRIALEEANEAKPKDSFVKAIQAQPVHE